MEDFASKYGQLVFIPIALMLPVVLSLEGAAQLVALGFQVFLLLTQIAARVYLFILDRR